MNNVYLLLIIFIVFGSLLALIAFFAYRRVLRRAKGIERGLKMVPLLIHLPPPGDEQDTQRDHRDLMRERVSQSQMLYDMIAGTATQGFASSFYGQRHIAFEVIASNGLIHYFVAVPVAMVSTIEQAVLSTYPGARIEEVEDHNIFSPQGKLTGTVGGELTLRHQFSYPIATYDQMERDPMEALINTLSKLQLGDGAAIQIMLRPAKPTWTKASKRLVARKRHQKDSTGVGFTPRDLAMAAVKAPEQQHQEKKQYELSHLEETMMQAVEEKTRHPGFEILIRVLVSSPSYDRSQALLRGISTAFALFEAPGSNGFQFLEARDVQGLVTAFIFRFFPPEVSNSILSSPEMATLFHLPDSQFNATSQVERQHSKQIDGPANMPTHGLLLGYNFYRGTKKEVHLDLEDRRRHMYIVGQTGTGKSTILENLAVQDMLAGNGFAFVDPHGDVAEKLVSMVPKERAEDVIYFNPADTEHPLGINLFEFDNPDQKDFIINEAINLLYKLYDPGRTGIMGPRFEHWFRNAALTLMADPDGATFIELPKVFTDTTYLKNKFKYLDDPTVQEFWTKEMGQTSDYHKSEMLGWFVSKFGAFQTNEMMRNIIGQTHSAFNIREIMDQKKILIVNLSKGQVGELNSKLLGMLFVMKIQQAAMSRANIPESERVDFSLYVDEFQNFSTDSFASILSEARKYRLNLIVANQFIGQLTDEIRDAVFGNVGTKIAYRTGPEDAEFLVKQYEPAFDVHDLINLPNFNSVIRLMVGGLPTQPFSMTALPPLGEPHQEMLLAVKQLSAAKYGVPRGTVEADIFARLQNKPRLAVQPAAQLSPAAQPAPQPAAAATVVPTPAPQPASTPPPVSAPTTSSVPTIPSLGGAPQTAPAPVPAQVSAPAPRPQPVSVPAPVAPTPPPAPVVEPKPQPASEAPKQSVNPDFAHQQSAAKDGASIADVVGAEAAKPKPVTEPLLIETHEKDGRVDSQSPIATAPQPILIEAEERDGKVDMPTAPTPQPQPPAPAPRPAPKSASAPAPKARPEPKPTAAQPAKEMIATHRSHRLADNQAAQQHNEPIRSHHPDKDKPQQQPKSQPAKPAQEQERKPKSKRGDSSRYKVAAAPKNHQQPKAQSDAPVETPRIVLPVASQSALAPESVAVPQSQSVPPISPVTSTPTPATPSQTDTLAETVNKQLESLVHPGQQAAATTPPAPSPAPQPQAQPNSPTQSTQPVKPQLKPGEVMVDDEGNVIQG